MISQLGATITYAILRESAVTPRREDGTWRLFRARRQPPLGVNFRQAAANIGGVSSLCISGMGTLDNTLDMSAGVFWDNIRIDHRKDGFMMIVR